MSKFAAFLKHPNFLNNQKLGDPVDSHGIRWQTMTYTKGTQRRHFLSWKVGGGVPVEAVKEAASAFSGDIFIFGDEPDANLPQQAREYAQWYDDFAFLVKSINPRNKVAPAGFIFSTVDVQEPPPDPDTLPGYMVEFNQARTAPVDEYNLHFYLFPPKQVSSSSNENEWRQYFTRIIPFWKRQVANATSWCKNQGVPLVVTFLYAQEKQGVASPEFADKFLRPAMRFLASEVNIAEAVYWSYWWGDSKKDGTAGGGYPWSPSKQSHKLVDDSNHLTPEGLVFQHESIPPLQVDNVVLRKAPRGGYYERSFDVYVSFNSKRRPDIETVTFSSINSTTDVTLHQVSHPCSSIESGVVIPWVVRSDKTDILLQAFDSNGESVYATEFCPDQFSLLKVSPVAAVPARGGTSFDIELCVSSDELRLVEVIAKDADGVTLIKPIPVVVIKDQVARTWVPGTASELIFQVWNRQGPLFTVRRPVLLVIDSVTAVASIPARGGPSLDIEFHVVSDTINSITVSAKDSSGVSIITPNTISITRGKPFTTWVPDTADVILFQVGAGSDQLWHWDFRHNSGIMLGNPVQHF